MNYTLNQLRIFLKIVQTRSITKASEELHLTQPAVSIQLKNFQNQFDIPLLEIVNKKIYITDFGKEIAESADKILTEIHSIDFKTHSHKGQLIGKLNISIVSTGKYIFPHFLTDFIKMNPGVELFLDVTNKTQVLLSLEKNEVDFALVSVLPKQIHVDNVELMKNKLFVIGNCDEKFSEEKYNEEIFEKLPIIYREEGSGTRIVMEKFIKKYNLPIKKKMELTSNEAVKQAVIAGLGYSIMPLIGIKNELDLNQLQIIPVNGFPIESTWNLVWLKNKKHSHIAISYLNYIKEAKQKIIEKKFNWFEKY